MKKIFLFLLFSSFLFAQQNSSKSLTELKVEVQSTQRREHSAESMAQSGRRKSEIGNQILDFGLQNSESNIENPASSIQYQVTSIQPPASRKNPGLAIIYSLLLPGMGELYAGGYDSGKYFTIADGLLWGVFIGFDTYGNWKKDNYKSFAQSNAGVNIIGKDADYFANIGTYISIDEYNRIQDLNREYKKTYNVEKYYWDWKTEAQRKEYKQMWTSSESAYNNVRFAVGALILNRLISIINAVRLVSAHNKNLNNSNEVSFYFSCNQNPTLPERISLHIGTSF